MKSTQLAQISLTKDRTGATTNPIYLSTAYQHEKLGCSTGFDYTRTKNPTRSQFEEAFAKLEGGKYSFATSSGMASIQLICNLFKPNDEILVSFDLDRTGATTNPIYLSTAYQHEKLGCSTGFDYTRTKNPTRSQFEEAFAKLEGGKYSFATSSGMASIQLICNLFKPNDEILVSFD